MDRIWSRGEGDVLLVHDSQRHFQNLFCFNSSHMISAFLNPLSSRFFVFRFYVFVSTVLYWYRCGFPCIRDRYPSTEQATLGWTRVLLLRHKSCCFSHRYRYKRFMFPLWRWGRRILLRHLNYLKKVYSNLNLQFDTLMYYEHTYRDLTLEIAHEQGVDMITVKSVFFCEIFYILDFNI